MARGRPKDPTRADRETGHRARPGEAQPMPELPPVAVTTLVSAHQPPPDVPEPAHDMWHLVVGELCELRMLHESDLILVEQLVISAYRHRQAAQKINELGVVVKNAIGSPIVNPLLKVEKDTAATYQRLAETLGLTPVARLRLGLMRIAGETMLQGINERLAGEVTARIAAGR